MGFGQNDDDDVVVKGDNGTDVGQRIAAVGDGSLNRLAVDSNSKPGNVVSWLGSSLIYEEMNASTNGIARGTTVNSSTWRQVYQYTGAGIVTNYVINLEEMKKFRVRMVVDGIETFGANGIYLGDMEDENIFALNYKGANDGYVAATRINFYVGGDNTFNWGGPLNIPMTYLTSFQLLVKRETGESSKKFRAGFIIITKS